MKTFLQLVMRIFIKQQEKFIGNILQVPPMYSAIKYKGKSLYNIARKGKTIELKPREVTVSKFEIVGNKNAVREL